MELNQLMVDDRVTCLKFNRTGRPDTRGATRDASESLTSKITFYTHIFGDKKIAKKIQSRIIYRNLHIGSPSKGFFDVVLLEKYEVTKTTKIWAEVPPIRGI